MDWERGSHAQRLYPTQDALRMGTARLKQEEKAATWVIVKEYNKGKYPKQHLTSVKILPLKLLLMMRVPQP